MTSSMPAMFSADPLLWTEFNQLCDCGGRLAGTASETAALDQLTAMGRAATGVAGVKMDVPYAGWKPLRCTLILTDGRALDCHPLVRSAATPPTGLDAEVIDLGRGTPEEFAAHTNDIAGRIVLVRHELMFAAGTIHRGKKYQAAVAAGAVGFLIAGPVDGHVVSGSSGRDQGAGIPAVGISPQAASTLGRSTVGYPRVELQVSTDEAPAVAQNLLFEVPGAEPEWVILSAHIDGHDLAESAIDNASGLAVSLAVARYLAPAVSTGRRGLRLAFFNVEEWALTGSDHYVTALSARERDAIALNVNLDSVAGGARLTALTSGFSNLEPFLLAQAERAGVALSTYRPLQMNSDHGNFARAGIPAFRLVAGFNDRSAATSDVLTPLDNRDRVTTDELNRAARLSAEIVRAALVATPDNATHWRSDQTAPQG